MRGTVRWVMKVPAGSATMKRRSPTAPAWSTCADWTGRARRDLTGWMYRAARCIRATSSAPLGHIAHLNLDPFRSHQLLRPLGAELGEPARARKQRLLERSYGRVEAAHGRREALCGASEVLREDGHPVVELPAERAHLLGALGYGLLPPPVGDRLQERHEGHGRREQDLLGDGPVHDHRVRLDRA